MNKACKKGGCKRVQDLWIDLMKASKFSIACYKLISRVEEFRFQKGVQRCEKQQHQHQSLNRGSN